MAAITFPPPAQPAIVAAAAENAAPTIASAAVHPAAAAAKQSGATGTPQRVRAGPLTYVVSGNHLLPSAEVAKALESGETPQTAIAALKQAYEDAGYFLVALVGEEHGQEVTIRVIQGEITHVDGPAALTQFFNGLKNDDTIRKPAVMRRTILAQQWAQTNDEQLNVRFEPAPEVGGSRMVVSATPLADSHPVGGGLTFGNYGNRYAGRYLVQGSLTAHHAGFNASLGYARALPGLSNSTRGSFYQSGSGQLSWTTPWGIWGVDGSTTRYHLGRAFEPLFPKGGVDIFGATGTQLAYADSTRRWSVSEGLHRIHENQSVFSGAFSLYNRRYTVADLGTNFSWRFDGLGRQPAAVQGALGIKQSLDGSGFPAGTSAPVKHFTVYTANANITQTLPRDWQAKFDLSGQTTPDTLPPYEQWVLGGLGNLGAYMPGTVVGDKGYLARLQLNAPQWRWGGFTLRPEVYAEYGTARFRYIAAGSPRWQTLSDAGVGLHLAWPASHLSATLAAAAPLGSHGVDRTFREGQRIHLLFLLQASF